MSLPATPTDLHRPLASRACPRPSRCVMLACLMLLAATGPVVAQEGSRFSTELALDVGSPQVADVTEDGRLAVVVVRTRRGRVDVDHERYGDPTYVAPALASVMVVDTRSGTRSWLHEQPVQASGFTWSPDGTRLAYLLHEGARFELRIHEVGRSGSSGLPLRTDMSIASSSPLLWSPDGTSLLVAVRPGGWEQRAREAFHALTDAPVIVQDSRDDFLAWDRVRNIADEQITVLISVADGSVREVLRDVVPREVGFTEDGGSITYATAVRTRTSYTRQDGTEYGLYALDIASGEARTLVEPSEDRVQAAWNEARDAYAYAKDGAVHVGRLGEDEPREVTEGIRTLPGDTTETRFSVDRWSPDGSRLLVTASGGWYLLDPDARSLRALLTFEEDEDLRPRRSVQRWSRDGRYLYFSYSAPDRWERGLKRLDVESGDVTDVTIDTGVYGQWNVSADGSTVVHTWSDGDRPEDVWVTRPADGSRSRLTELNPQLADVALTRTELVPYLDVDGNTLYGILYYPIGYEPGRAYPLVAEVYEQFFDNGFNENMNLVTARGWFGFRPSVRFEEGYPGEAWLKAVPNAVNKLIERGLVDAEKVGVYGQSYGGYAVNLLITQTDRFAAAANVSGKVNIISFLGDSEKITTRNYAAAEVGQDRIGATLWEQPHKYIAHSAVMFADRIRTPLLLITGQQDHNVTERTTSEMYYALRRLGRDVEWVSYINGGHGMPTSTVEEVVDYHNRILEWYDRHLKAEREAAAQ
jgi:dipeptidyl aminopeptidase/acylaminoacyl peptidase